MEAQAIVLVITVEATLLLVVGQTLYGVSTQSQVTHQGVIQCIGRNLNIHLLHIAIHILAYIVGYALVGIRELAAYIHVDSAGNSLNII